MEGYYTLSEIIARHHMARVLDWNDVKVGHFYYGKLLVGKGFGKNCRLLIYDESFIQLLEFANQTVDLFDPNPEYLDYDQVCEIYPQTERHFNWTPSKIGIFYHSRLLQGKKSHVEARNVVTSKSVRRLIEYVNNQYRQIGSIPLV